MWGGLVKLFLVKTGSSYAKRLGTTVTDKETLFILGSGEGKYI